MIELGAVGDSHHAGVWIDREPTLRVADQFVRMRVARILIRGRGGAHVRARLSVLGHRAAGELNLGRRLVRIGNRDRECFVVRRTLGVCHAYDDFVLAHRLVIECGAIGDSHHAGVWIDREPTVRVADKFERVRVARVGICNGHGRDDRAGRCVFDDRRRVRLAPRGLDRHREIVMRDVRHILVEADPVDLVVRRVARLAVLAARVLGCAEDDLVERLAVCLNVQRRAIVACRDEDARCDLHTVTERHPLALLATAGLVRKEP